SNEWTWVSGTNIDNNLGTSGQSCTSNTNNAPGARWESRACWTRACNNLVVFGGSNSGTSHLFNDLWNYNVSSNEWTWMSGNRFAWQSPSSYGIKTVSSPANFPSPRMGSVGWTDDSGNLWIFGGYGHHNDMWRFVPDSTCPSSIC